LNGLDVDQELAGIVSCTLRFATGRTSQITEQNLPRDKETANRMLQVFLSLNGQMNGAITSVEHRTSPEEYEAFKRRVGHVIYEVCKLIFEPI
jgi:hypothetical protein